VLETGLSPPRLITSLSDADVAIAEQYYVETTHRRALEKYKTNPHAWDLADATVRAATQLIYNAGGFSHQHARIQRILDAHDMVEAKKKKPRNSRARC
jgi:hypothetical protein